MSLSEPQLYGDNGAPKDSQVTFESLMTTHAPWNEQIAIILAPSNLSDETCMFRMDIGKYGEITWADHSDVILKNNMNLLKNLHENGSQIIITTSRPKSEKIYINKLLNDAGIKAHEIICDLNHSQRVLINDFNTTNIYPTALAVNLKRNNDLSDYINFL